MAHELPFIAAIDEAIMLEMERDDTVLYFGQNMATTENEPYVDAFGKDRVRVTPISETAEIGMAHRRRAGRLPARGRALHGRVHARGDGSGGQRGQPLPRDDAAARSRSRSCSRPASGSPPAGRASTPARSARCSWASPASRSWCPSTAADAKGLMATAIRDDNPVVYLHHYLLTLEHGEVPDGEYLVPFGQAAIRREGGDVTIVGTGWTVDRALGAAEHARRGGHRGRGDRPAHARTARHADDPRVGRRRPVGWCSSTRRRGTHRPRP